MGTIQATVCRAAQSLAPNFPYNMKPKRGMCGDVSLSLPYMGMFWGVNSSDLRSYYPAAGASSVLPAGFIQLVHRQ